MPRRAPGLEEMKQQFSVQRHWATCLGRGLLTALLVFLLYFLYQVQGSQDDERLETFRRETDLSIPELAFANGTEFSHLLLPDGRLSIHAFDTQQHREDMKRIESLFPDKGDRQVVLKWGEDLFESCRLRYRVQQWTDRVEKKDKELVSRLLSLKPSDSLCAHAAWQRLKCGPGVEAQDLMRVKEIVTEALRPQQPLTALLSWAEKRRWQRCHKVRHLFHDQEHVLVVRPLVPDLEWFKYWILYEEWGVTDSVFSARKQDFLKLCGDKDEDSAAWKAVQDLGRQFYEERRKGGDDSMPELDDRCALIAVIDRFSGLDPVFAPRLYEAAKKHFEWQSDAFDPGPSFERGSSGSGLFRFLMNSDDWMVVHEPSLTHNRHRPYCIADMIPENYPYSATPTHIDEGSRSFPQFIVTVFLLIPFTWLTAVSVHFFSVDVPGTPFLFLDTRFRRFAAGIDQYGVAQLILWWVLAFAIWLCAGYLPAQSPIHVLLGEMRTQDLSGYVFIIVLGSLLTQAIDNLVIIVFLLLRIDPFKKWMWLDNVLAVFLSGALLLMFEVPFTQMLFSVTLGSLTPVVAEKLGIINRDNAGLEMNKGSWGCSGCVVVIFGLFLAGNFLFAYALGIDPLEKHERPIGPFRAAEVQPVWWEREQKVDSAKSRTWNSKDGTYKTEAKFVSFSEGVVTLKKTDGKVVRVPLERLSAESQTFVTERGWLQSY